MFLLLSCAKDINNKKDIYIQNERFFERLASLKENNASSGNDWTDTIIAQIKSMDNEYKFVNNIIQKYGLNNLTNNDKNWIAFSKNHENGSDGTKKCN
jgi:hypothetical protein